MSEQLAAESQSVSLHAQGSSHSGMPMPGTRSARDCLLKAGARAIATTSAGVAATLGYPDGQKIPRTLMLEAIARIVRAVDIPVTADIEAGYATTPAGVTWKQLAA